MATVVDALVMTLGLDVKEFDKGKKRSEEGLDSFKDKADGVAKDVSNSGKRAAEFFGSVKTELLGVLAIFGAATGLKQFISTQVTSQAALGRLSANVDISARKLESWGLVAKEMGGQAEDAFGAIQAVGSGLAEASIKGSSALTDMARINGVALTDAKGKVLGIDDALLSISKRMHELPRLQAQWLANGLGVGSMFNELMLGPDELKKRLAAGEGLSKVTDKSTEAAMRLQKSWADIQQRFKGVEETAFARLSPTLERLANRFANWLDSVNWEAVGAKLESLINGVNKVVDAFGGWKTVALVVGAVLALKVLAPITGLILGLGRLIPLLASATAGLGAMGVAGAAAVGYMTGTAINDHVLAGTKAGDWVGKRIAGVLAAAGNDDAKMAIARDNWSSLKQEDRQKRVDAYQSLTPAEKSTYRNAAPELSRIIEAGGGLGKAPVKGTRLPRGVRNNNPGNLNFAGQEGATKEGGEKGRFAVFEDMSTGVSALVNQLEAYSRRGIDTITEIVNKYAPAGDNNDVQAYIKALASATGKDPNAKLDLSDMHTLVPLVKGIVEHEGNGKYVSAKDYAQGIMLGAGPKAATSAAPQLASRTSTAETHIGSITVNTQATDAKGIVMDMRGALDNNSLIAQADTGLN
jgi:hypothetical protein